MNVARSMIEVAETIAFSRGDREFKACVSLVQGNLDELSLCLGRLHPKEKKKYRMFQYDRRRVSYLLGRYAAKRALTGLQEINPWESIWIDSGVFEFPVVRCTSLENIQVSISHCDSIGVSIAFEEAHPMGIDIEKVDDTHWRTMLSQITDKEKVLLKHTGLDNPHGYTIIWSMKESLAKVIKTGMMMDFSLLQIDTITEENQICISDFTHFGQYKAVAYSFGDYVVSITLPKKSQANYSQLDSLFSCIKHL